ncbi:MAG: hypothetical protein ACR2LE_04210 [Nocardioidaceae bacterium]
MSSRALALAAVGVTMYDSGAIRVHLAAIFVPVLVFALTAAMLVLPPAAASKAPPSAIGGGW